MASSCSTIVTRWASVSASRWAPVTGLDLIHAKPDLNDRRRKPIMLTRKGRHVINKILEAS